MTSWNPIRRSTLKRKSDRPKKPRAPWHPQVVKLDPAGMARLRSEAFARSQGICECGRPQCERLPERLRRVTWFDGNLHHLKPRSDELDRVLFVKRECHEILHGRLQWGRRTA